jgi:predicted RNase H-like HicB family nuclease
MTYTMSASMPFAMHLGQRFTESKTDELFVVEETRREGIILEYSKAGTIDVSSLRAALVDRFVLAAMRKARLKGLGDEGVYADIPRFRGVWGDGATEEAARADLEGVLRAWIALKIDNQDGDIPKIDKINLNVL